MERWLFESNGQSYYCGVVEQWASTQTHNQLNPSFETEVQSPVDGTPAFVEEFFISHMGAWVLNDSRSVANPLHVLARALRNAC